MNFNVKDDLIQKAGYSKLACENMANEEYVVTLSEVFQRKCLQRNWNYQDNLLGHLYFIRIDMTKNV